MKDKKILIMGALTFVVLALGILSFVLYNKNNVLNYENTKLRQDRDTLDQEKNVLINDREDLRNEILSLNSELSLLKEDVANIYKGCISQNACKGRYPGIRWTCNNVGDAAEGDTASHICECDSSCNLSTTEIKK